MYTPPFDVVAKSLDLSKNDLGDQGLVEIPVRLFKLLLRIAVASEDFDEASYLKENPDVQKALKAGELESGFQHYIRFGYFEGRKGGAIEVDERWYASKYPDIAVALKSKTIESAASHFHAAGAYEGRSPNADFEDDAEQWKFALQQSKVD